MNAREAGMQGIAGYLACSHGQGIVQLSAGICPVRTGTETGRAASMELSADYLACLCRHENGQSQWSSVQVVWPVCAGMKTGRVSGARCRLFGLFVPA